MSDNTPDNNTNDEQADDTEGHGRLRVAAEEEDEDVTGHGRRLFTAGEDDVEGHGARFNG